MAQGKADRRGIRLDPLLPPTGRPMRACESDDTDIAQPEGRFVDVDCSEQINVFLPSDSRFARAGCLGRSSSGWVSSVGAEPSPSHATGLPAAGTQPFPNAQQFASISAATRNAMHFEIIVILTTRQSKKRPDIPLHQVYTGRNSKTE